MSRHLRFEGQIVCGAHSNWATGSHYAVTCRDCRGSIVWTAMEAYYQAIQETDIRQLHEQQSREAERRSMAARS